MAKDGTNRGGRRVRAGAKPEPLNEKLADDAPGEVRRRVQQDTTGHRGRKGDPLYQIRLLLRASHTQAHPTPTRTPPRSLRGR